MSKRAWLCALSLSAGLLGTPAFAQTRNDAVALFVRHYLDAIYPDDSPSPQELSAPASLAVAKGEYEPLSIGVLARTALMDAKITPSDLVGKNGEKLVKDQVKVLITRYVDPTRIRALSNWPKVARPLQPAYLDALTSVNIAAGKAQQFWVTVHAPENAAPGLYKGDLVFSARDMPPLKLPLSVEVYPFTLREARAALYCYADDTAPSPETYADCFAHGMNTICVGPAWSRDPKMSYKDKKFEFPGCLASMTKIIEMARAQGLGKTHPIGLNVFSFLTMDFTRAMAEAGLKDAVLSSLQAESSSQDPYVYYNDLYSVFFDRDRTYGPLKKQSKPDGVYYPAADPYSRPTTAYGRALFGGWVGAFETMDKYGRDKNWPGFWYYLIDEPAHSRGAARLAVTMCVAAREAAVESFVTCSEAVVSEPDETQLWFRAIAPDSEKVLEPALRIPFIKIRSYAEREIGPETLDRSRQANAKYGACVNFCADQPVAVRYQAGYLSWRLGLDNVMFWEWSAANVRNDDGGYSFLREWEALREGIDDLRYVETLEGMIKENAGTPETRAAAAKLLEAIRVQVHPGTDKIGSVDGVTGQWVPGENARAWTPQHFDELRWKTAAAIVSLIASK